MHRRSGGPQRETESALFKQNPFLVKGVQNVVFQTGSFVRCRRMFIAVFAHEIMSLRGDINASSKGLDLFIVLGQKVAQLDLERGRQHLVVGGPLLGVEDDVARHFVAFPVG